MSPRNGSGTSRAEDFEVIPHALVNQPEEHAHAHQDPEQPDVEWRSARVRCWVERRGGNQQEAALDEVAGDGKRRSLGMSTDAAICAMTSAVSKSPRVWCVRPRQTTPNIILEVDGMIPQYRDLWRFRAPLSAGEIRRTERWLATARVALAIAAEVTLWMEPARGLAHSRWLFWLLTVYFVHAVVVMLLVRFRPQSTKAFRLVVHAADVVWPVLIYLFATAQRGPFVLFFVFVLAAAAYRWGLWETVVTALSAVVLLWAEAFLVRAELEWTHFRQLGVNAHELDSQQLVMFSVYLIVLGFLLGYMSENQKKVRAERAVITRVLSSTRVEAGLTGTMQQIMGEVMSIYGARRVLSASQEAHSYRVFLAEINRGAESFETLRWREALPEREKVYLFDSPADAVYASRRATGFHTVLLDRDGGRLRDASLEFLDALAGVEKFDAVASVGLMFGAEWSGRVFLFDPEMMGIRKKNYVFCRSLPSRWRPQSITFT
jgi:hypothetical protein